MRIKITLTWTFATDYDAQINMLETAIGSGKYDAIAVAPAQSESVATQVDAASDSGIAVVAFNSGFDSKNKSTFVGTGNEAAAKAGGKAAAEAAIKRGSKAPTAVVLTGVQGDETHEASLKGYTEGIEEAGGKVVGGPRKRAVFQRSAQYQKNGKLSSFS